MTHNTTANHYPPIYGQHNGRPAMVNTYPFRGKFRTEMKYTDDPYMASYVYADGYVQDVIGDAGMTEKERDYMANLFDDGTEEETPGPCESPHAQMLHYTHG